MQILLVLYFKIPHIVFYCNEQMKFRPLFFERVGANKKESRLKHKTTLLILYYNGIYFSGFTLPTACPCQEPI